MLESTKPSYRNKNTKHVPINPTDTGIAVFFYSSLIHLNLFLSSSAPFFLSMLAATYFT